LVAGLVLLISSDYAGTTQTKVVLESDLTVLDLTLVRHASHLPAKLCTLGEACSSKGMSLRDKPATWIHYAFTFISKIISVYGLTSLAHWTKSKGFVSNELICGKAIVKLANIHVLRCYSSVFIDYFSCCLGHIEANKLD
jgi:hypothetical protein